MRYWTLELLIIILFDEYIDVEVTEFDKLYVLEYDIEVYRYFSKTIRIDT